MPPLWGELPAHLYRLRRLSSDRKVRCGNCEHCKRERIERGDRRARPAYHIGPREVSHDMGRRRLGGVHQGDVVPCTSLEEVIEVLRRAKSA